MERRWTAFQSYNMDSGALGTDGPEKSSYFITPTVVPLQTSSKQFNY